MNKKYLILYPEDFIKTTIWEEICEIIGVSKDSSSVKIQYEEIIAKTGD